MSLALSPQRREIRTKHEYITLSVTHSFQAIKDEIKYLYVLAFAVEMNTGCF